MGYRSEVIINIEADALNKIRFITPEKIPILIREYLDVEYPEGSGELYYYTVRFNDIKWYEYQYPEINEVMRFLASLKDSDFRFHRLGDDFGDYETIGDLDDDTYPTQSLGEY